MDLREIGCEDGRLMELALESCPVVVLNLQITLQECLLITKLFALKRENQSARQKTLISFSQPCSYKRIAWSQTSSWLLQPPGK